MSSKEKKYILLILLHVVIGLIVFFFPPISKPLAALVFLVGLFLIVKNQNKNHEVLLVSGYIVGSEIFFRMTGGIIIYEFAKYSITIFMLLGMYYSGFSKNAIPYWIFLVLLIPGILVATETLNLTTDLRKTISFNISGPICLGISSIYTYNKRISLDKLNQVLLSIGLPIISTSVYVILYTPDLKEALVLGTGSNYNTSGGFGPNQVATIFGLGMFIFFSRLMLESKTKLLLIVNLIIAFIVTYRGLITFSRGGMITGFMMIVILLFYLYISTKGRGKIKLNYIFGFMILMFFATWSYTSSKTDGLIEKRYANQDAMGRVKESQFTGREEIFNNEINSFIDNPIFGVGVAKGAEIRLDMTNEVSLSHNEISRMIAEHGLFGITALLILLFTPIILFLDNKQHIFLMCFIVFWLLTINHAAMRLSAAAFVYSLSLLKVHLHEETPLHRK
ncbi:O-antigen ligase [Flavobacterium sp.]|uniref:O-antigen ligase family protein n=1 Tax=Flavobacterium sp. TaxID=239 RepID=UPI0025CDAAC1|nr:O-antigen ligase family protein [Flavobacterium sp.]